MDIVLFDGVCNLCNGAVKWIYRNDPHGRFRFAPLSGDTGQALLQKYQIDPYVDSIVLIQDDGVHVKSDAILRISRKLGFPNNILYPFVILPVSWRDGIYDWVARNRYKWFGRKETCMVPTGNWRSRFLE